MKAKQFVVISNNYIYILTYNLRKTNFSLIFYFNLHIIKVQID